MEIRCTEESLGKEALTAENEGLFLDAEPRKDFCFWWTTCCKFFGSFAPEPLLFFQALFLRYHHFKNFFVRKAWTNESHQFTRILVISTFSSEKNEGEGISVLFFCSYFQFFLREFCKTYPKNFLSLEYLECSFRKIVAT